MPAYSRLNDRQKRHRGGAAVTSFGGNGASGISLRTPQHDGDGARHGGQDIHELGDGLWQVVHRPVRESSRLRARIRAAHGNQALLCIFPEVFERGPG
jgi:hypothetical protein